MCPVPGIRDVLRVSWDFVPAAVESVEISADLMSQRGCSCPAHGAQSMGRTETLHPV